MRFHILLVALLALALAVPVQCAVSIQAEAVDSALAITVESAAGREEMGRRAREHVLQTQTWDRVADRFLEVLK